MSKERPGVSGAMRTAVGALAASYSGVPTISTDAASSALKKMKDSSGRAFSTSRADEERLRRRSRKMAKDFEQNMEKSVKKKLDSMRGSQRNSKVGLKVAQFIPGKGLEVPGTQAQKDPAVYCSLGLKGVKLENCFDKLFETVKGKSISQDFAFKLICDPELSSRVKNSRVATFNCFRHVNPDSFNYLKTGWFSNVDTDSKKESNRNWHTTLGPDASHIRRSAKGLTGTTDAGTWRGDDNDPSYDDVGGMAKQWVIDPTTTEGSYVPDMGEAGYANSLLSSFRTPYHKEVMYSRLNRQVLENYGFSLNPLRFKSEKNSATWNAVLNEGGNQQFTPSEYALAAYRQPSTWLMNFGEQKTLSGSDEKFLKSSLVAQINNDLKLTEDKVDYAGNWEYHSQFGSGKISYQFGNDGTNPVCIDVCVIGVKKSETAALDNFADIAQYNYAVNKFANFKNLNVGGYDAVNVQEPKTVDIDLGNDEWISDAKLPFIPSQCFKNPQSYLDAVPNPGSEYHSNIMYNMLEQGKKNPFKVVKRDQFIVSSGATRSWNTVLPSFKYRPQLFEDDVLYPTPENINEVHEIMTTGDEYTFMVAIGAHGMAVPVEEIYPGTTVGLDGSTVDDFTVRKRAILDRQASSCNVSVVGSYTEIVHAAYPEKAGDPTFINGRMIEPYFSDDLSSKPKIPDNSNVELDNRFETVNINTQAQTVRVSSTGITGVGAISTQVGA